MIDEKPLSFAAEGVELVTVPDFFTSYEEMWQKTIVHKLSKNYPPGFSLLIFINNIHSNDWLPRLNNDLKDWKPFKTVWTLHLLTDKENKEIQKVIVNKLRPFPVSRVVIDMSNIMSEQPPLPQSLFDEIEIDGKKGLKMKPNVQLELSKMMKKIIKSR